MSKITGADVLNYLLPNGGWSIREEDFDSVIFYDDAKTITRAEFEAGFTTYAAWKQLQDDAKSDAKAAVLHRLGITAEEAALLLS